MTTLYNCRHSGDQYRISKFDGGFDVESSYLCTESECECPAGHRPSCRHREMLPKFLARDAVGTEWFYDYDRSGWVQGLGVSMEKVEETRYEEPEGLDEDADVVFDEPVPPPPAEVELCYQPDPEQLALPFPNSPTPTIRRRV